MNAHAGDRAAGKCNRHANNNYTERDVGAGRAQRRNRHKPQTISIAALKSKRASAMGSNLAADLARLSPTASKAIIQGIVDNQHLLDAAGINTPIRLRHFFARACVETGGLRSLEENLFYSAQRLTQVWPKRFPNIAAASPYAKNPEALANKVYGGRLGNFKPGDGWTFRGSGIMQNTGRENFELVEHETGLPVTAQPELLRTFPGALRAATIFWTKRNINALADKNDTLGVCHAVNGGTNGLTDQRVWLIRAAKVWPDGTVISFSPAPQPAPPAPVKPVLPPVAPAAPSVAPPAAPEPTVREPQPLPPPKPAAKRAEAAGFIFLVAAAIAGFWHHITAFVSNLF